jgi:hypothetical protein
VVAVDRDQSGPLQFPLMRTVWRFIRYLFGFAEKIHTLVWLAEILGLMTLLTTVYARALPYIRQGMNRSMISTFFLLGLALLTLPRLMYFLYVKRKQQGSPIKVSELGTRSALEPVKLRTIDFGYMKAWRGSPLDNGWRWAEQDESGTVTFQVPSDAPVAGSLGIISSGVYGIDFPLQQTLFLTDSMQFSAKYIGRYAAFYVRVEIGFKDSTKDEEIWIAHQVGDGQPVTDGNNSKNWIVFLPGVPISNSWRSFKASVSDEVREIFQGRGGFLKRLITLRLRGNLSISPIELYQTQERCR